MSILRAARSHGREVRSAGDIPSNSQGSTVTATGVVAASQAMRLGAYWACVNRIADPISTLPFHRFTTPPGGSPERVDSIGVVEDPSTTGDTIGWRRQILVSWLTEGNAFAVPTAWDNVGRPRRLTILDPSKMQARAVWSADRTMASYEWMHMGVHLPGVIHWPAYMTPGSGIGLSPIQHAARAVGLGLSAEDFGLRWFVDGTHPTALLRTDSTLTAEDAGVAKERWKAAVGGRREPVVLGGDWKYDPISTPANESQFLETIQANVGDVCRFFGMKAEDIGGASGDSMTYANVEQRALDFLTYPIYPWVVQLETILTNLTSRPQTVKINVDALVRVDLMTRYQAHDIAIRSGMSNVDNRLKLEDLPPLPDGTGQQTLWPPYATNPAPSPPGAKP